MRSTAPGKPPSLRVERQLLRQGARLVAGVDEVGRGALGGPVTLGIVVVDAHTPTAPHGVRDSKLLTPSARERLAPRLRRWAVDSAVGSASAAEIDEIGIMAAMRLAGRRALSQLQTQPCVVILDGNHDYLSPPAQEDLFAQVQEEWSIRVATRIKADMTCASVAAASVLAKTSRDAVMVDMHQQHPAYCWDENKGYASPSHLGALAEIGPCVQHRRSWRLPGRGGAGGDVMVETTQAQALHSALEGTL